MTSVVRPLVSSPSARWMTSSVSLSSAGGVCGGVCGWHTAGLGHPGQCRGESRRGIVDLDVRAAKSPGGEAAEAQAGAKHRLAGAQGLDQLNRGAGAGGPRGLTARAPL